MLDTRATEHLFVVTGMHAQASHAAATRHAPTCLRHHLRETVPATPATPGATLQCSAPVCEWYRIFSSDELLYLDTNACLSQPCGVNATCQDLAAPSLLRLCPCDVGFEGDGTIGCTCERLSWFIDRSLSSCSCLLSYCWMRRQCSMHWPEQWADLQLQCWLRR